MSEHDNSGESRQTRQQPAVERREFLRRGVAALGAGYLGLGGVRELLASAGAVSARAYAAPARAGAIDPFRIACVGDSVVWGQGLAESSKFHTQVQSFLAARLNGRPIEKQVVAHSGAKVFPSDQDAAEAARVVSGEVPRAYPSVTWQATRMVTNPASVNLVLLDGGINDVGATTILDPTVDVDWVRQRVQNVFGEASYVPFLQQMLATFPNATIVVTNYFQVISGLSDIFVVSGLAYQIGGPIATYLATIGVTALKQKWSDQYKAFDEESTAAIARSVYAVGSPRLVFADNLLNDSHAMGTGSWRSLWNPGETDEVQAARSQACWDAGSGTDVMCKAASTAHPNVSGARSYASAINKAIVPSFPRWGIPTMMLSFVDGGATSTTKTVTVYAKDTATGQPLSGTAKINGVSGALGTPIRYSTCFVYTVDDGVGTTTRTKEPVACSGTVYVSGYPNTAFTY